MCDLIQQRRSSIIGRCIEVSDEPLSFAAIDIGWIVCGRRHTSSALLVRVASSGRQALAFDEEIIDLEIRRHKCVKTVDRVNTPEVLAAIDSLPSMSTIKTAEIQPTNERQLTSYAAAQRMFTEGLART